MIRTREHETTESALAATAQACRWICKKNAHATTFNPFRVPKVQSCQSQKIKRKLNDLLKQTAQYIDVRRVRERERERAQNIECNQNVYD